MKTKQIIYGVVAACVAVTSFITLMRAGEFYISITENEFIRMLTKKTERFNEQFPQDRVYLHFDKPFYEPGEAIWFSAYLRDGATMKPSSKSDIIHVELLNPKGSVEKHIRLIAKNGQASGDFSLDEEQPGGLYKVKAYTTWMKNEGDSIFFEKEIQVQDVVLPNLKMKLEFLRKAYGPGDAVMAKVEMHTNENKPLSAHPCRFVMNVDGKKITEGNFSTDAEGVAYLKFQLPAGLQSPDGLLNVLSEYQEQTESISRSVPIVLNKIRFSVYPEGGDLVNGLETRVAFRALNENGKPADVEGIVVNQSGKEVASFKSFHNGMGAFSIKPEEGENYTVRITRPANIKETIELPAALPKGYVLNISDISGGQTLLTVQLSEPEEVNIIGQVRGKIYYSNAIPAVAGTNKIALNTLNFPMGVAQFTLFDKKGIARAERLVFVNKNKQLNISVKTDKDKYLPREKVNLTLMVTDERGIPMPGNFSVSVVNDQLLSFADDKSGNILSQLFLEQDLKEKVEEPFFYFNPKEPKAGKALDLLLMTSGWRRFEWKTVMEENPPAVIHPAERAVIAGTVMDYSQNQPVADAEIKIDNTLTIRTDGKGRFWVKNVELFSPVTLSYTASGFPTQNQAVSEYNSNLMLYLYKNMYGGQYNKQIRGRDHFMVPQAAGAGGMEMDREEFMMMAEEAIPAPVNKRKMGIKREETKKGVAELVRVQEVAADLPDRRFMHDEEPVQAAQLLYYRARVFSAPVYDTPDTITTRTDFRNTIYWNGNVEIDRTGKKTIAFYNSDDISSFRVSVEGIAEDGMAGRAEKTYYTQLPFSMSVKVPVEVATEDLVSLPLTLINNTTSPLGGILTITDPQGLKLINRISSEQTIMPGKAKVIYLDYKVESRTGEVEFKVCFMACGLSDAFSQKIKIVPKGFPVTASFSGSELEAEYKLDISNVVKGSLKATLTAYPNVVSDLMKGIEAILREPHGCFEQTSVSSYPNLLVLDYLKTTGADDPKLMASAENFVDKGYKRLTTFETKENGYEWFGGAPAHEALTAYGLMQFVDMKNARCDVDNEMIDRTAKWILSRRDGKGGFLRNPRALDNFGSASEEITNAYIVWALAEAEIPNLAKETDKAFTNAENSKDPYQLALVANAMYKLNDKKRGDRMMELLYPLQAQEGSWTGTTHSVTRSSGVSLTIETTSLAILAMLKSQSPRHEGLTKAVEYIVKSRSGYGMFGSTQGTILALKALVGYAAFSKRTVEDGTLEFYVNGRKVADKDFKAGEKEAIVIDGLEQFLGEGKYSLKIKYRGVQNPLPYSVAVGWNTFLPQSSKECKVALETGISSRIVNVGETVRLNAMLKNLTEEGLPSTLVILGIPAGLTAQPWQLKELQEKKKVDYYEISGNNLVIYYRQMAPGETKEFNLDLKAEIPGDYDAPASSAYLYYTNEHKCWRGLEQITVKK